jgi:hypothetical protein
MFKLISRKLNIASQDTKRTKKTSANIHKLEKKKLMKDGFNKVGALWPKNLRKMFFEL